MAMKTVFNLAIILAFGLTSAFAQTAYTPAKGSAERAAIMTIFRMPIEKELKQKVQFSVEHFKVSGGWAFLSGAPQNMSGGRPNYKGTPYQSAVEVGAFDNNFFALLRKTGGKWKVVTYAIGCTDVCYLSWWKDHKAPKAIFPHTK
jgi:hypothetical protein